MVEAIGYSANLPNILLSTRSRYMFSSRELSLAVLEVLCVAKVKRGK